MIDQSNPLLCMCTLQYFMHLSSNFLDNLTNGLYLAYQFNIQIFTLTRLKHAIIALILLVWWLFELSIMCIVLYVDSNSIILWHGLCIINRRMHNPITQKHKHWTVVITSYQIYLPYFHALQYYQHHIIINSIEII